ncbi:MAG: hypothetical protein Q9227_006265 [Pyrenula ochraceoflavens]
MTALEITHSLTLPEIDHLVSIINPHIPHIANYTTTHRARLIKPMLSYDAAAVALSFVPATTSSDDDQDARYTYHHLRRDLWSLCTHRAGLSVASRYVVPSAHLTIARFNSPNVFDVSDREDPAPTLDVATRKAWIDEIEEINAWLERDYWPRKGGDEGCEGKEQIRSGGQWIVGEEQGLDCHKGTLWYGGGERVLLGEGF